MNEELKLQLPEGGERLPQGLQVFHTKEILWRITRKCHLACPHCYADAGSKDADELTTEEAKSIMDSLAATAQKRGERFCIAWMGGEPVLRDDLLDLMQHAKSRGFAQHMGTSGTIMDERRAAELREGGLTLACVSLDSYQPEIHERLKGKGTFSKAVQGIKLLKQAGIEVMTVCVMTRLNFGQMDRYEQFCREELGCRTYFSLLHRIGRAQEVYDDIALSREQLIKVYTEKYRKIHDYISSGRSFELPIMELFDLTPFMDTPKTAAEKAYLSWGIGCQGCRFCLGVDYNGDLWPCERMPLTLGNLKTQTLEEIEETELFKKIQYRTGKQGKCAACEHVEMCGGGCLAEAYGATGDAFAECPYCWYDPAKSAP